MQTSNIIEEKENKTDYIKYNDKVKAYYVNHKLTLREAQDKLTVEEISEQQHIIFRDIIKNINHYENYKYINNLLYYDYKLVIPESLIETLITIYHCSVYVNHLGINKMYQILNSRFKVRNLRLHIEAVIHKCTNCAMMKLNRKIKENYIQKMIKASRFNELLQMDIKGPLPNCNNYTNIISLIDIYSGFVKYFPVQGNVRGLHVIQAILEWISIMGHCEKIHTDNGSQFVNKYVEHFMLILNITHIRGAVLNPKSQGVIERSHRVFNDFVKYYQQNNIEWLYSLYFFQLRTNGIPKHTKFSPSELVYGVNRFLSPLDTPYCVDYNIDCKDFPEYINILNNVLYLNNKDHKIQLQQYQAKRNKLYERSKHATHIKFKVGEYILLNTSIIRDKYKRRNIYTNSKFVEDFQVIYVENTVVILYNSILNLSIKTNLNNIKKYYGKYQYENELTHFNFRNLAKKTDNVIIDLYQPDYYDPHIKDLDSSKIEYIVKALKQEDSKDAESKVIDESTDDDDYKSSDDEFTIAKQAQHHYRNITSTLDVIKKGGYITPPNYDYL